MITSFFSWHKIGNELQKKDEQDCTDRAATFALEKKIDFKAYYVKGKITRKISEAFYSLSLKGQGVQTRCCA
jgi:hypothetical protein